MSSARFGVAVLAAVLPLVAATTACADGDPASDFLLTQKVFLPYDARISATRRPTPDASASTNQSRSADRAVASDDGARATSTA